MANYYHKKPANHANPTEFVRSVKDWALANYEKEWGASVIIECLSDNDIANQFHSLRDAQDFAKLQSEMRSNTFPDDV